MKNQDHQPEKQSTDTQGNMGALSRTDENNQPNLNAENQRQDEEIGASAYGASYQNEEKDSSKEENEFKQSQSLKQDSSEYNQGQSQNNNPSHAHGETTDRYKGGHGDQEDDIANEGDGSGNENKFDDLTIDSASDTTKKNDESSLSEKGENSL